METTNTVSILNIKYTEPDEYCPEYSGYIIEERGCIAQAETLEELKESLLRIYWIKKSAEFKRKDDI